jgi:hypothetical protein
MPPVVNAVLRSPGQPLDAETRAFMEPRFRRDFSGVRVHTDAQAAESALAVDALAYMVGRDVVFSAGRYAPGTTEGRRLLAHELAHVVQQSATEQSPEQIDRPDSEAEHRAHSAAEQVISGREVAAMGRARPGTVQREEANEEERRRMELQMPSLRLQEPVLGESLGSLMRPSIRLNVPPLQLDPQIAAQIRAIQFMQGLITVENIMRSLRNVESPGLPGSTAPGTRLPLTSPTTPPPGPLVPRGAGPSTPRAATISDLLDAVMGIPVVQNGITRLRSTAEDRLRRDWNRLSGGERALLITQGVLITGSALAGVLANNEGRRFVLDQVQGRTIPIPGLPMTFQFNVTGPDQRFVLGLNVGALLPRELGFR